MITFGTKHDFLIVIVEHSIEILQEMRTQSIFFTANYTRKANLAIVVSGNWLVNIASWINLNWNTIYEIDFKSWQLVNNIVALGIYFYDFDVSSSREIVGLSESNMTCLKFFDLVIVFMEGIDGQLNGGVSWIDEGNRLFIRIIDL